jgi:hypothetical protein
VVLEEEGFDGCEFGGVPAMDDDVGAAGEFEADALAGAGYEGTGGGLAVEVFGRDGKGGGGRARG